MSDFPEKITINEEGPREGFQIEAGPISTDNKVALIDALSATGLQAIQVCSFVSPRLVPGWADASDVVQRFKANPNITYTALWFNAKGIERALSFRDKLDLQGTIHVVSSEAFSISNLNRDREKNLAAMREQTSNHLQAGIAVEHLSVMAAFGCNFAGDISPAQTVEAVEDGMAIAADAGALIREIDLADTMGWANPEHIKRTVGAVRDRWPDVSIGLHLHDTRGLGIANAYAGLSVGVSSFDTTVGGLGGCPFAAHPGAPGNIATEELVLLANELNVETGVDLESLITAGHLAEKIVGRPLPSAVLRGGSLPRALPTVSGHS
jgi:hydroxymethylglutaryl-CoA lyase